MILYLFYKIYKIPPQLSGKIPYTKKGKGEACSPGTEIISEIECEDALRYAPLLGITLNTRYTLVKGSWGNLPHQCSYQSNGDQAFYFNREETNEASEFLNGWYKMICRTGKFWL